MHEFKQKAVVPLHERMSLSPEEASALTGIGMTSIRQAVATGALKASKLGTRTVILRSDLEAWLRALPTAGKKLVSEAHP